MNDAAFVDQLDYPARMISVERARLPRNWTYAAQQSRRAVNELFETTSGISIYDSSDLQRYWRDVNSAAQHMARSRGTIRWPAMAAWRSGLAPQSLALRHRLRATEQ